MRFAPFLLLIVAGCVSPLAALRSERALDPHTSLRARDANSPDAQRIANAVEHAQAPLERWGGLIDQVTVFVVPTHDELETAVHRRGFSWLRAWSRRNEVIFQAPSSWHAPDVTLEKLVLHELTHCLLFQRTGTADDWTERDIPLWFREGMAVQTAGQQQQYPGLEDVARWLEADPSLDVFNDGDRLSLAQSPQVYAFSLYAFAFLQQRHGDAKIIELMQAMGTGRTFAEVFGSTFGTGLSQFEADFLGYLKFRAFRGTGRTVPIKRPDLQQLLLEPRRDSPPQVDPRPQ